VSGAAGVAISLAAAAACASLPARADVALRPLTGPSDRITSVSYSPDGKYLVAGGVDREIHLFDGHSGTPVRQIDTSAPVLAMAWRPDSTLLLAATTDAQIHAWTPDGTLTWTAKLPARVLGIAMQSDGSALLASLEDGSVRWLSVSNGKAGRTLKVSKSPIVAVAISRDGKYLACSEKVFTTIFNAKTLKPEHTVKALKNQWHVQLTISPDSRLLALGDIDGEVEFVTLLDGNNVGGFTGTEGGAIRSISYNPAGNHILTAASDRTARLFDIVNGVRAAEFVGHGDAIASAALSPDGKEVATGGDDAVIRIFDADSGVMKMKIVGPRGDLTGVAYIPQQKSFVATSTDGVIRVWDAATGLLRWQRTGHKGRVTALAVSGDGRYIVTSGGVQEQVPTDPSETAASLTTADEPPARGDIRIWNAADGQMIRTLGGHTKEVDRLALSSDGRNLVSSAGGDVIMWNMETASGKFRLPGATSIVDALAIAAGGTLAATGERNGMVRLYDASTSGSVGAIDVKQPVTALALSSDADLVAVGTADGSVQLWNASKQQLLRTMKGHTTPISALWFSPDGWQLVSASRGTESARGEARLWITQTGALSRVVAAPAGQMTGFVSASFAPDAQTILLGAEDHSVRVWTEK
jgi:WD40 repeat protein